MLMKEHPVYSNYLITSNGDVISKNYNGTKKKGLLKSSNSNGYLHVILYKDKKKITKLVHCLVAETFLDNIDNKPEVNHRDGVKHNNFVSNLEWCTTSENVIHAFKLGLRKSPTIGKFGKDHNNSIGVIQYNKNTDKVIKIWDAIMDIERELGIANASISKVCQGKLKSAGGFKWKYVNKCCIQKNVCDDGGKINGK